MAPESGTGQLTLKRMAHLAAWLKVAWRETLPDDMNLQQAYPGFIVLCMSVGGFLAHRSGAPLAAGLAGGLAVGMLPPFPSRCNRGADAGLVSGTPALCLWPMPL